MRDNCYRASDNRPGFLSECASLTWADEYYHKTSFLVHGVDVSCAIFRTIAPSIELILILDVFR